ncbi:amino acid permease [Clostridium sp. P21]|uniref:Amino acid permease n=1 Tax=Clostridium muellerianum TaxID=2716538 RepID=A0A7Y0HMQ7_9CLOT|nr:amino acid permease [Clostridium muellerianum]NMM62415.1 amino acid permease [Clostridium muellerianum]
MENNKMKKSFGFIEGLAIVVGMVIGSGVFFKPTAIFTATGAPGLGIAAWIIGGCMSIAGGLTAAEIGAAIPKTGGVTVYLKEIYGSIWEFLFGWAQSVIYFPGLIAALSIIFGTQAASLMGLSKTSSIYIAIGIVLFLSVYNAVGGAKASGKLQNVSTVCKLIPLALIIIVGFVKGNGGIANLSPMTVPGHPASAGLGAALIAVLFAYDGWINVGAVAGEMKNPAKDLPRSIIGGILIIMLVYTSINIAYLFVLPASTLAATPTPAADVARIIFGANGGKIITIGILISIFGALNAFFLTGPRVPYALAADNKLPASKWFAKLDKNGTPVNSNIFITVLAILYIITGKFDQLTNMVTFTMWFFFLMTFAGVYVLRKKQPNLHRPYKVNLYPFTPLVAIFGGIFMLVSDLMAEPLNAGLGIIVTLIGLPIYIYRRSKVSSSKGDKGSLNKEIG